MTNQTAVTILKNLEQSLDDYCELNDEGKEAFRMAITALELFGISEQLPSAQPEKRTDKCTETHACDLISRQAAIDLVKDVCDAIMSCCGSHYDEETDDEVYDDILEIDAILKCNKEMRIALKNMPSAEPERKTGKWIYNSPVTMKCNQCGLVIKDWDWHRFKYCPNCDAVMNQKGGNSR